LGRIVGTFNKTKVIISEDQNKAGFWNIHMPYAASKIELSNEVLNFYGSGSACWIQKDLKEPFKGKTYVFEWEEKHDSIEDHLDFYINGTKGEYRGIIGFGGIDSGRPQVKGNIFTNNTNGVEIVQAYKPGKWHKVRLDVMIDEQKYNIYIDGTKKVTEANFKTTLDAIVGFGLERQSSAKTPKGVKVRKFKEKGLP
ncbi:MAG: hypothetical protein AAB840_02185, partial [Patescibacteria group bacterium]